MILSANYLNRTNRKYGYSEWEIDRVCGQPRWCWLEI